MAWSLGLLFVGMWGCASDLTGTWQGEPDLVERHTGDSVPSIEVTLDLTQSAGSRVQGTVAFDSAESSLEPWNDIEVEVSGMHSQGELLFHGLEEATDSQPGAQFDFEGEAHSDRIEGRLDLTLITKDGHRVLVGHLIAKPQ